MTGAKTARCAWTEATARLAVEGLRMRALSIGFVSPDAPGLIIHPATMPIAESFGMWTVTHRSSGRAVLPFCPDRAYAENAARMLASKGNFRRPYPVIVRDHEAKALAKSFSAAFSEPVVRPERGR